MEALGLMSLELWEACPGPSSHQRRLSPTPATGRQDILKEPPCPHQVLRPCQSPGPIFLFLSNSLQGPVRKPQNAKLQGQQVRLRGPGAGDHSALLCLTKSLTQAQDPSSLSPRPAPRCFPQPCPQQPRSSSVISMFCGKLQQIPPSCEKLEESMLEREVQDPPIAETPERPVKLVSVNRGYSWHCCPQACSPNAKETQVPVSCFCGLTRAVSTA
uniref:Uncharacterized protein n=1 Tax=Molossus molossus TaxID=27622 RepID=A0A7J8I8Z1_MOLMO|nr:hypothetical protein HJG59_010580 [Molossus molossus]